MEAAAIARKRAERAARKTAAATAEEPAVQQGLIFPREWVPVRDASTGGRRVRVVSWNMLAQSLVRRELFPGSDCLKTKDRFPGLAAELLAYDWDIGCFQATLGKAGYAYHYELGYDNKRHGLMIAWRARSGGAGRPAFLPPVYKRVVHYDDTRPLEIAARARAAEPKPPKEPIHADASDGANHMPEKETDAESSAQGVSRLTRNIACIVALPFEAGEGGVVVATTHLFWHPRYAYERVRQAAILMQEVEAFRSDPAHADVAQWPVVVAGDFNDQPHSATYALLTGQDDKYEENIVDDLADSRVVHASVDQVRGIASHAPGPSDGEDEDRALGRVRSPAPGELLSMTQIKQLFQLPAADGVGCMQSVYGTALPTLVTDESGTYFSVRIPTYPEPREEPGTLRRREPFNAH